MKTLSLTVAGLALALSACSSQPMPPYQSGDGGRGLNPGARTEASTGSRYSRNKYYPTHGDLEDVYGHDFDRDR